MSIKVNNLKRLVSESGKTMKEFIIQDMGLTEPSFYRGIKKGNLSLKYLYNAARALDVDINEIYEFEGELNSEVKEPKENYFEINPQTELQMIKSLFTELQQSMEILRDQIKTKDEQIELLNHNMKELLNLLKESKTKQEEKAR